MKKINIVLLVAFIFTFISGFRSEVFQDTKWVVPETAKKVNNPLKNSVENITLGKGLYMKHCKSCHGKAGEGDGTKSAELKTSPGDFSSPNFQSQSDGSLFYKTSKGRDDMPSFSKKVEDEEDIWAMIHFVRTLKAN
jgi:mono/diheme cytochrome c family protein